MLLEMLPDVTDCLEDAREWQPKSYQEHFRDSSFSNKELAVAAYDQAPAKYRELFEETAGRMNELVATGLARLEEAISGGEAEAVSLVASRSSRSLQRLVDVASAIIHGGKPTLEQDENRRAAPGLTPAIRPPDERDPNARAGCRQRTGFSGPRPR